MENNALFRMQQDMCINRYDGEPQANYVGRVIYSALCHWMRFLVMDETTQRYDAKSKAYILGRMRELLNSMAESFPVSKKWIYGDSNKPDDGDDLIHSLRDKMLAAGELLEVDNSFNIGLPMYTKCLCTAGYVRVIGLSEEIVKPEYIGVTRVVRSEECNDNKVLMDKIVIDEYLDWIYAGTLWDECHELEVFEFFDPFSRKPPYQSWTNVIPKSIDKILARMTLFNGLHEYYLMKMEHDKCWSAPIPAALSDWKEERRVMMALRKRVGNRMKAACNKKDTVCVLNLYCGLPLREQGIIDTYCWPLNSMNDKYNYVVPMFIWEDIKGMLTDSLGIELKSS